jgi:hypothetical protein
MEHDANPLRHDRLSFSVALCLSRCTSDVPTADDEVPPLVGKIIIASGRKAAVVGMSGVHASGDREAYMRRDRGRYDLFSAASETSRGHGVPAVFRDKGTHSGRGYRGTDTALLSPVQNHRLIATICQYRHFHIAYGLMAGWYSIRGKTYRSNSPPWDSLFLP